MSDPFGFGGLAAARGTVYLVGSGPGDLGLLTTRATTLLASATFVAYDRLSPEAALAACAPDAEMVYVGKMPDRHALPQDQINALLVEKALEGHAVVRFKGGDPFVFGRGSEEAQECVAAGVPFEVVPGVTSAIAGPAYAGVPVTHRGLSPAFAVITGHEDPTKADTQVDYPALAAFPGTLVFLMGVGRIAKIAESLIANGRSADTPVAMVRWGTMAAQSQLTGTLSTIAAEVERTGFGSPAVTVIGEVAGLADELGWITAARPLLGRKVLVPRSRAQASELSRRLRALGAEPIEAPTITIEPTDDQAALDAAVRDLRDGVHDWVAFTSANGVDAVLASIRAQDGDSRWLADVEIACVGSGTQLALEAAGLRADLVPPAFTTASLAEAMVGAGATDGAAVLLPRADISTATLHEGLVAAGARVTEVEAYRTAKPDALADDVAAALRDGTIDAVALGSSSTIRNLVDLLGGAPASALVSIGPVTSETCRELGLDVAGEADPHDIDGLVAAVVAALT